MLEDDTPQTVLLAEDDENDILLIRRAFSRVRSPGRLITLTDGEQVIPYLLGNEEYCDRQRYPLPNILVLDRRMRALSGLDVLFWLRSEPRFKTLPVLVLSNGFAPNELLIVQRLNAAHAVKTTELNQMPKTLELGMASARQIAADREALQGDPIPLE